MGVSYALKMRRVVADTRTPVNLENLLKERAISRLLGIWYRYKNTDNWSGTALEIGDCIINKTPCECKGGY